jgi:hypothetical protein
VTQTPTPLSLADAIDALASPYAHEQYSQLTGDAVLLVELAGPPVDLDSEAARRAHRNLRELPCVSIGVGLEALLPENEVWARAADVWIDANMPLEPVLEGIANNPIASLAMVQLTRHSEPLSIHEGLIAESLVYSTLQSGPEFTTWLREREARAGGEPCDEPAVRMLRDGARLHLTFDRPERRNAFSAEMRDALSEALRVVDSDDSIGEVVLRGAGPAFCSGGDLSEFGTLPDPATAHVIRSTRNPGRWLARVANRMRAEVHGACVGAGIELPAFTSHVRAKRDAWFWLPEIGMGLVPGAGGTVSLPRRIGRQHTNWMALSRERVDAERALRLGLVDEVVD